MRKLLFVIFIFPFALSAQLKWVNVDIDFQPLPEGVHIFFSNDLIDGKPNRSFYVSANLQQKQLLFETQIGNGKRYTPSAYYDKEGKPLLVVNATFFEFVNNSNLNVVVNDSKILAYPIQSINGRGKDTFTYRHPFSSAIGINKKRKADIAWLYTDSSIQYPLASQAAVNAYKDSSTIIVKNKLAQLGNFNKWKMTTAIGGGPVLVQNGATKISNNEEIKFIGKAVLDKHPRTAMGYTIDGNLIIMAVEGRFPGKAEGANLEQLARLLTDIGCEEALNLDGGGSSCLLINGKETITPSDKEGQRPVPAVWMIKVK